LFFCGDQFRRSTTSKGRLETGMGILWIILIVVLVLALLGFFSRGYW
jgi:flagellar basal body-associated protein FliL